MFRVFRERPTTITNDQHHMISNRSSCPTDLQNAQAIVRIEAFFLRPAHTSLLPVWCRMYKRGTCTGCPPPYRRHQSWQRTPGVSTLPRSLRRLFCSTTSPPTCLFWSCDSYQVSQWSELLLYLVFSTYNVEYTPNSSPRPPVGLEEGKRG